MSKKKPSASRKKARSAAKKPASARVPHAPPAAELRSNDDAWRKLIETAVESKPKSKKSK